MGRRRIGLFKNGVPLGNYGFALLWQVEFLVDSIAGLDFDLLSRAIHARVKGISDSRWLGT